MHFLGIAFLVLVALAVVSSMRGGNGLARLGNVIYWLACGIACLLIVAAVFATIAGHPEPVVLGVVGVLALLVWLGGLAVRYVVRG